MLRLKIFCILILFVSAISGLVLQAEQESVPSLPINEIVYDVKEEKNDIVIGDTNALVTIVSYTSLTCTHCADFHNVSIPAIGKKYIDTGKIKIIIRHFPLDKIALYAAAIVEKMPPSERLDKLELLFKTQDYWLLKSDSPENLSHMCNMTFKEFEAYVTNEKNQACVLKQWLKAKNKYDVKATPSFIIQGRLYEGDIGLKNLSQIIDQLLQAT